MTKLLPIFMVFVCQISLLLCPIVAQKDQKVCRSPDSSCMNKENYDDCMSLLIDGCPARQILKSESCPAQFSCEIDSNKGAGSPKPMEEKLEKKMENTELATANPKPMEEKLEENMENTELAAANQSVDAFDRAELNSFSKASDLNPKIYYRLLSWVASLLFCFILI